MADKPLCSIPDCGKQIQAKGLCCAHYNRLRKHGDPMAGGTFKTTYGQPKKWLEDCLGSADDGCIAWPFAQKPNGYGDFRVNGRMAYPHRYICEKTHGPPPFIDMQAGHLCGNRLCCNPRHLRWVTRQENEADKLAHGTWDASRVGLEMRHVRRDL